jgi:hypothetical protein
MCIQEWKSRDRKLAFIAGVCVLGLEACSLSSPKSDPSLYVDLSALEDRSFQFSLLNSPNFLAGPAVTTAPQSATGFSCYGVNVTGPGIPDTSNHPEPDPLREFSKTLSTPEYYCAYRGIVTPPMTVTQGAMEANLQVPPGSVRLVQVLGVSDPAICGSGVLGNEANQDSSSGGSRYYEIGRVVIHDMYSDQSVNVAVNWPSTNSTEDALARQKRSMDCGDGNCSTISQTLAVNPVELLIGSTANYYAQKITTVPGKYIRRASFVLRGNLLGYPTVDVKAQIYEAPTGNSVPNPGSGTLYSKTLTLEAAASASLVNFDFYQIGYGYLQMQSGKDYWIVVSSPDAVTSASYKKVHLVHAYDAGNASTTDLVSWNGASWIATTLSNGAVYQAYGCGG